MQTILKNTNKTKKKTRSCFSSKKKIKKAPLWKRKNHINTSKAPWFHRWQSLPMLLKRIEREKALQNYLLEITSAIEKKLLNK